MSKLLGFFDESGTHLGSPVLVVAGYVATPEKWLAFDSQWKEVLDSEGLPYFHMNAYENRKGLYADWDSRKRVEFLKRLMSIIHSTDHAGFMGAVEMEPYERLTRLNPEYAQSIPKPHVIASTGCVAKIRLWAVDQRSTDNFVLTFEKGAEHSGKLGEAFTEKKHAGKLREYRIEHFSFGEKKEHPALQAADLLAYEVWKLLIWPASCPQNTPSGRSASAEWGAPPAMSSCGCYPIHRVRGNPCHA